MDNNSGTAVLARDCHLLRGSGRLSRPAIVSSPAQKAVSLFPVPPLVRRQCPHSLPLRPRTGSLLLARAARAFLRLFLKQPYPHTNCHQPSTMPPLYLGRYPVRPSFCTEDFAPKMAKFTGKSPSTDKAFAFGPRVRVDAGDVFPDEATVGVAPFRDLEGRPLYVGTVILDDGAIPCYIDPQAVMQAKRPATRKVRQTPSTRYDVLIISSSMQWMPAENGRIPPDRYPVHGGHENSSPHLYHAIARIGNTFIPGKTSPALGGAYVTYQGEEYFFDSDYYILCWR